MHGKDALPSDLLLFLTFSSRLVLLSLQDGNRTTLVVPALLRNPYSFFKAVLAFVAAAMIYRKGSSIHAGIPYHADWRLCVFNLPSSFQRSTLYAG